jgi:Fur family ferric uptake transcriptional regulator
MENMYHTLFLATLDKNKLSHTKERLELFDILKNLEAPCTITALVSKTKGSMNKSTVYRTIDLFEKIHVSKRVYSGWKFTIELSDQFSPHHHHMTCTNCGQVLSFLESQSLMNELLQLENSLNVKITSHSIELKGLCRNCI